MKLTLAQLKKAELPLQKLMNNDKLGVKTAYKLSRAVSKIDSELKQLEAARIRLINKYGKKEKDGAVNVTKANMGKFINDMESLLKMEIEIDMHPLKIEELPDDCGLSAADLSALDFFIIGNQ